MTGDPYRKKRAFPDNPTENLPPGTHEPSQLAPSIHGEAYSLVDPRTGEILAADAKVADWLRSSLAQGAMRTLCNLIPEISPERLSNLSATAKNALPTLNARIHKSDGTIFPAAVSFTQLIGTQENHLLVTIRPIEISVKHSIHCDALTGLPDRRELYAHRSRWQQLSPGKTLPHALLFLDLDKFKQINDQHGHAVGDRLLTTLAGRWQRCIREEDLLVRYGGDEFVVLLAGIQQPSDIEPIVHRLLTATTKPIAIEDQLHRVGATIGVALAEDTSVKLDQLIASADRDMYRKKSKSEG